MEELILLRMKIDAQIAKMWLWLAQFYSNRANDILRDYTDL